MQYRFSRQAERDIEEIGDYIARDNPRRAVTFIAEIRERCGHIVQFPHGAPARPALGRGVRCVVFGRYLIFYVVRGRMIEIRRVLHGARNITAQHLQ